MEITFIIALFWIPKKSGPESVVDGIGDKQYIVFPDCAVVKTLQFGVSIKIPAQLRLTDD